MQKEQRSGNVEPQSAGVWLDARGEWQVQGVVRHDEGNLRLNGSGIHILRAGRRGLLRRTAFEEELAVPVATLISLRVLARGRRRNVLDLELHSDALTASNGILMLRNCRPAADLRVLVEKIQTVNQGLRVEWQHPPGS